MEDSEIVVINTYRRKILKTKRFECFWKKRSSDVEGDG